MFRSALERLAPRALKPVLAAAAVPLLAVSFLAAPAEAQVPGPAPGDANHAASSTAPVPIRGPHNPPPPAAALAALWTDDFNRANSTNMGADWTEAAGDMIIQGNQGQGNLATGWSHMLHNSAALSPAGARMQIDLAPPSGSSGPHVALIAGAAVGSTRWFYTKIQDNDSNGTYDRIFFYSSGNGGAWGANGFLNLTAPIAAGRVHMYFTNGGDTLHVDIDMDFNGSVDQQYSNTGALAVMVAGTGFGIGTWAMAAYDNWRVDGCAPASQQTYGAGFPGTLGVPPIAASTNPVLGGNTTVDVGNSLGTATFGVVVIGLTPFSAPMPWGGTLLAFPDASVFLAVPSGGASLPLSIPFNPSFCGLSLFFQGGIFDSGAAAGIANTQGLELVLGS